jgi:hypothetical protein
VSVRAVHLAGVAAVALALAGCASAAEPAAPASPRAPASSTPATGTPAAPPATGSWLVPADASAAAQAAGLPMLGEEKLAVHYHAHLDVIVGGTAVPVPAGLGIDEAKQLIAPLHTHDGSGIVHIESATDVPFTLGQLFTEWGQPLRADRVGPVALTNGTVLRVYRNGQPVTGDPAALRLGAHDEIVVWVGPGGQPPQVPGNYIFPPGT